MKISRKLRIYIGASIAVGALGLSGAASAGSQVGVSVSVSGTRAAVVDSGEEHVCTYEQRPVTRTYTDASGGSYEHRTYETVRVCTHAPEYYPEVAPAKVYKETRPKARKERRKNRQTSYSIGVGFNGGSPSFYGSYGTSTYYGPYPYRYRPYPRHHYGYYGHHSYSHYGHHSSHSSISLSYGHGGSHHGYGHHGYGHYGRH